MKPFKFILGAAFLAGVGTMIFFGCKNQNIQPKVTSNAKGGSTSSNVYDPLTLSCSPVGNTQTTIALTITAGPSGAPAGFSIQWMTKAQFDAIGDVWPADTSAATYCKASFSGVPYGSKNTQQAGTNAYNLPASGSVTVYIGDLLNDELNQQLGLSTTVCNDGVLQCGTQYVFRAFAHANSTKNRSAFTIFADQCATTAPCGTCNHMGLGGWKQLDTTAWPVNSLTIGGHTYTRTQLLAILNQTPNGNGLITLAHQLIPAELNNASSQCPIDVSAADAVFVGKIIPPVGTSSVTPSSVAGLVSTLHGQNDSCTCPQ